MGGSEAALYVWRLGSRLTQLAEGIPPDLNGGSEAAGPVGPPAHYSRITLTCPSTSSLMMPEGVGLDVSSCR